LTEVSFPCKTVSPFAFTAPADKLFLMYKITSGNRKPATSLKKLFSIAAILICFAPFLLKSARAQDRMTQAVGGTLVVAVPVSDGLVVCSDKRLFNDQTGTFTDDFVKIRKVGNRALYVATHTIGFLDKATGKMAFDVFALTNHYVAQHEFVPGKPYWNGLSSEIRNQLSAYLTKQRFEELPETDTRNNGLLFNLVFYAVVDNKVRSYSLSVFYQKARTPVVYIADVVSQEVKTPQLTGKGKDVIAYLARNPAVAQDPSILRFDQSRFDARKISPADAIAFANKLFYITNTAILTARVSATYDCASINYQSGFQWIDKTGAAVGN